MNYKVTASGCWEWQKSTSGDRYGVLSFFKRNYYVHRLSYRLFKGEIMNHQVVMHSCDNPPCFNPEHLNIGTQMDNVRDMHFKKRYRKPGPSVRRTKFSNETVAQMRSDYAAGMPSIELRNKYSIGNAQLWRITRGKVRI